MNEDEDEVQECKRCALRKKLFAAWKGFSAVEVENVQTPLQRMSISLSFTLIKPESHPERGHLSKSKRHQITHERRPPLGGRD